jgi:hypothetical protein
VPRTLRVADVGSASSVCGSVPSSLRRGTGRRWRPLAALLLASVLPATAAQVSLAWNDNSSDETMFKIERAIAGSTYTQIATVGANVASYTDASGAPDTSYWYRVRASNSNGDSAYTNVITVTAPTASNSAPLISDISNLTIASGASTGARAFTVSDAETAAGSLVVTGSSSNTTLVPNSAIVFGGSGTSRTIAVTPVASQSGTATITVTVSDGALTASDTFELTVTSNTGTNSGTFANSASIGIPGNGMASLYPAPINVSGLSGTISNVTVRLNDFNESWAKEVDILLVSPTGQKLLLMSDVGWNSVANATFTFSDAASALLPASESLASGTYKPTNYDTTTDSFPSPAPDAPYASTLATFNGENPNGQWSLFVMADGPAQGSVGGGWSLTITTNGEASNTAPTISNIATQSIAAGSSTAPLAFTVGDAQTTAGSLTVTRSSSNTTLVPTANIVLGGSGADRTVTVSGAPGQSGTALITLTVSDGTLTSSSNFNVTAVASNTPPAISNIPDITIAAGTSTGARAFTVSDTEATAGSLVVTGSSSNPTLVPNSAIAFGGSGTSRTIAVTPVASQSGTATITVTVSDGALTASDTFELTVTSSTGTNSGTFANSASIGIPGNGKASLYPAPINVSGLSGTTSNVTVRLNGFNQTWAKEVDVLLVSPTGQKLLLMSDVGRNSVANASFTFSDAAKALLPSNKSLTSGTYKPTNYDAATDGFPSPAPAAPYASTLATFNGQNPNGQWSLFVMADGPAQGSVSGGWSLTITTDGLINGNATPAGSEIATQTITAGSSTEPVTTESLTADATEPVETTAGLQSFASSSAIVIPEGGSEGAPYPAEINVTGIKGVITDVTVQLKDFSQVVANDMDVLLVSPTGQKLLLMSDVGTGTTSNAALVFSDKASAYLPEVGSLTSGTYRPTNYGTNTDVFSAPAPAGPYASSFSTFHGQSANGIWSLYVRDPGSGQGRRVEGGWSLSITTAAEVIYTEPRISLQPVSKTATAGQSASLCVIASGTPAATYQWMKNGVPLAVPAWQQPILVLESVTSNDVGVYRVEVRNEFGTVVSDSVTLSVRD